jgi:hypothetical protein
MEQCGTRLLPNRSSDETGSYSRLVQSRMTVASVVAASYFGQRPASLTPPARSELVEVERYIPHDGRMHSLVITTGHRTVSPDLRPLGPPYPCPRTQTPARRACDGRGRGGPDRSPSLGGSRPEPHSRGPDAPLWPVLCIPYDGKSSLRRGSPCVPAPAKPASGPAKTYLSRQDRDFLGCAKEGLTARLNGDRR